MWDPSWSALPPRRPPLPTWEGIYIFKSIFILSCYLRKRAAGVRVGCLFTACLQEWTTGRGLELTNQLENLSSGLVSTERPPLWAVCVRGRRRRQLGEVGHGEGGNLGVLLLQPAASFALSTFNFGDHLASYSLGFLGFNCDLLLLMSTEISFVLINRNTLLHS